MKILTIIAFLLTLSLAGKLGNFEATAPEVKKTNLEVFSDKIANLNCDSLRIMVASIKDKQDSTENKEKKLFFSKACGIVDMLMIKKECKERDLTIKEKELVE